MNNWSNLANVSEIKFTTPLPDLSDLQAVLSTDSKVLDIGCGYGRALKYLYDKGFKNLIGVDISESLIRRAKTICPDATYYVQDFEKISLNEKVDLILLMAVIEYISNDSTQDLFFRDIETLLSDDGYIFLETFTFDFNLNFKNYLLGFLRTGHFGRFRNSMGIECHHQSSATLRKILNRRFEIVDDSRRRFTTWSGNICKGHQFVLKKKSHEK
jgi:2-polyprenyl-3-methyl-5-hydroxy-6-metoxy-1,4-benzoquinol methylase